MINFHKSPTATFETLNSKIAILNQNIIYLTHEIDQIKGIVQKIHSTVNLKQQVLEHYDNSTDMPEADL